MDSSSDDDFAWANTSSESLSDKDQSRTNENHSDGDTEYGNKFKEKLHREIFNDTVKVNGTETMKSSKRKITFENSDSEFNHTSCKKIKIEPESDHETHKKSKKSKQSKLSKDTSEDENYLNVKVKEEQHTFTVPEVKHRKKNKRKLSSEEKEEETLLNYESKKENAELTQCSEEYDLEINNTNGATEDYGQKELKRKKKKKRRSSNENSITSSDSKFIVDEKLAVQTDKNNSTINTSLDYSKDEISIIEKVKPYQNNTVDSYDMSYAEATQLNNGEESSHLPEKGSYNTNDCPQKVSEQMSLEEDFEPMVASKKDDGVSSSKLKKFLKTSPHLKAILDQIPDETRISQDDEIWLIRCPRMLDVNSFKGKTLTLEGKCKVKLEGQSYEGQVQAEYDQLAFTSMKHNNLIVSSMPVAGAIHLRKRVPKTHLQQESCGMENSTGFIPLPVTKSRHPLFGANYKAAMRIPSEIADKLNRIDELPNSYSKKKKKKNKRHEEDQRRGEPKEEIWPKAEKSIKKKKRKKSDNVESSAPKKTKHSKCESKTSEAWDTEKAIEDNLFSY